jgi:hypothetical protein
MLLSHYATAWTQLFIEDCNALVVEGKELLPLPTHFCDRFAFMVVTEGVLDVGHVWQA